MKIRRMKFIYVIIEQKMGGPGSPFQFYRSHCSIIPTCRIPDRISVKKYNSNFCQEFRGFHVKLNENTFTNKKSKDFEGKINSLKSSPKRSE